MNKKENLPKSDKITIHYIGDIPVICASAGAATPFSITMNSRRDTQKGVLKNAICAIKICFQVFNPGNEK